MWRGREAHHYGPTGMEFGPTRTIAARMAMVDAEATAWGYTQEFIVDGGERKRQPVQRWPVHEGMMKASHFAHQMWAELAEANGHANMSGVEAFRARMVAEGRAPPVGEEQTWEDSPERFGPKA